MSERCAGTKAEDWPLYYYVVIVLVSAVNFVAFAICFYAEVSMLWRKAIRTNSFNLYVIFLLLPDTLNNLIYFLFGLSRATRCGKLTPLLSDVSDANIFFYYFSNFSLNCLVACELYTLLERSYRRIRTGPPSVKRTLWQVAVAYTVAILFTLWGIIDFPWSWWYTKKSRFGSPPGGLFKRVHAVCMVAGMMLGFILFVVGIRIRIWRKQLTPKHGRTRVVALFFQHIIMVFLFFYFPSIGLLAISTLTKNHRSPAFFGMERTSQILAALQALATVSVAAQKPDLREAIGFCGGVESSGSMLRWSIFSRRSTGRRWGSVWGRRLSVFGRATSDAVDPIDVTARTACETHHPTEPSPEGDHDRIESSRDLHNSDLLSSEWLMDDVYDTQISAAVDGEDNDVDEMIFALDDLMGKGDVPNNGSDSNKDPSQEFSEQIDFVQDNSMNDNEDPPNDSKD